MDDNATSEYEAEALSWSTLERILSTACETHEQIDDVLRRLLDLFAQCTDQDTLSRCCYRLLDSGLYRSHQDYIGRQVLYCLLQDDDTDSIRVASAICLYAGRRDESLFETMQAEGTFARLVELISAPGDDEEQHRLLINLLFEMARVQTLERDDLANVGDDFILYLFQLIESLSNDADDPYHYPVIRVLLVLNEQYMCYASESTAQPLTNRVLKLLSSHGPLYRTFGENIILLLNRESALGAQLLILKLLYLLFTTPSTFEYFYTNDLHVLVDVIIRNLLDLGYTEGADGHKALRHTYLRVLCPLLRNTQLARAGNHYKRDDLRRLMNLMINRSSAHFAPVDETVIRLVIRCKQIEWLKDETDADDPLNDRTLDEAESDHAANKLLGISLDAARNSSLSIADVSAKITKQKPSLPAPRRRRGPKSSVEPHNFLPTMSRNVSDALPISARSPFADAGEEEWT